MSEPSERRVTGHVTVDLDALQRRLERQRVVEFSDIEQLFALIDSEQQRRQEADERADKAERWAHTQIGKFKADAAAWWSIVNDLNQLGCLAFSNNACDRAREALRQNHPGAALLAELEAARTLAEALREHRGCLADDARLDAALAAYDATRGGKEEDTHV